MRVKDSFVAKALADARVQLAIAQIVQSELKEANNRLSEMEKQQRELEEEKLKQVSELNAKLELAEEKAKSLSEELEGLKEERVKVEGKLAKKKKQLNALKQEMFHLSAAYGDLQATNQAMGRLNEKMRKEAEATNALNVSLERPPIIEENDEEELQNEEPLMMEDDTTSSSDVGVGVLENGSELVLEAAENNETAAHSPAKRRPAKRNLKKYAAPKPTKVGRSKVVVDKHGIEHGFIRQRDDGRVACTCGKAFAKKEFSKHLLEISAGKLFSCAECDFRCFTTWHLKRHLTRIHNQQSDSLFGCRKCGATFNKIDDLKAHRVQNHNIWNIGVQKLTNIKH